MDLIKQKWTSKDINEFNKYIESIKQEEKIDFTKRIVNTNMEVLGIPIPKLREISKQIAKGNYMSFLDNKNNKYYENTIVSVCLINLIKDFEIKKHYLNELYIDNWSTCDTLTFKVKGQEEKFWKLSQEYLKSKDVFTRRVGVRILFSYKNNTEYVDKIFETIDKFYNEEEYYVNMMIAWYFATALAKQYKAILPYLEEQKLDTWTHNKAIQKSVESYRITPEQKAYLKRLKVKTK